MSKTYEERRRVRQGDFEYHLIPQYRSDPCWGKFKYIDAMEDLNKK